MGLPKRGVGTTPLVCAARPTSSSDRGRLSEACRYHPVGSECCISTRQQRERHGGLSRHLMHQRSAVHHRQSTAGTAGAGAHSGQHRQPGSSTQVSLHASRTYVIPQRASHSPYRVYVPSLSSSQHIQHLSSCPASRHLCSSVQASTGPCSSISRHIQRSEQPTGLHIQQEAYIYSHQVSRQPSAQAI